MDSIKMQQIYLDLHTIVRLNKLLHCVYLLVLSTIVHILVLLATVYYGLFKLKKEGWIRIYDLVIRGVPFDENRGMKNNFDDITLFRPYVDHLVSAESMESCDGLLWHLNDESPITESSILTAKEDRNVTIYFGKTYSVTSVTFMTSNQDDVPQEYALYFNGMESLMKVINLQNDCTLNSDEVNPGNFKEYSCTTKDLESYTFDYVTVNVKGLYKLHVYGLPFHFPKIEIIPSKEDDKAIDSNLLQISCLAQSCDSGSTLENGEMYRKSRSGAASCPINGHIIRCEYLDLFRLPSSSAAAVAAPNSDNSEKKQLTNQGVINSEITEIMTELTIMQSNAEKLVVTMPRTHQYYGQYQCSCQATDNKKSQLFSPSTSLKPTDFDQDFVFQTNYTITFADQEVESHVGFIELPENEQEGYFKFLIIGHSLLKDIQVEVAFTENGEPGSRTNSNTDETKVLAFPGITVDTDLWSIPAYRYEIVDAWPDSIDGNLVTVTWSMPKSSTTSTRSNIKDIFRVLVISPSGVNTIRAWIWQRDAQILDIRAYQQLGENNSSEENELRTLTLQRAGCGSENEDMIVATVQLTNGQCNTENDDIVKCTRTAYGQIVHFTLKDPSTSDIYKLYMKSSADAESTTPGVELVTSGSLGETVKEDIKHAGLSLTVEGIHHDEETQETELEVAVHIASKVITDNVACRPTYILLEFSEPQIETLKSKVTSKQTIFRIKLPAKQTEINSEMQLLIGSLDPTLAEASTKESVIFMNPFYIHTDIITDAQNQIIQWFGLPTIFKNLLHHYSVKLSSYPKACKEIKEFVLPITQQESENGTVYKVSLKDIPDSTLTTSGLAIDYSFKVTPVYKGLDDKSHTMGSSSDTNFSMGRIGQTELKAPTYGRYHSIQVHVIPSQLPGCLNLESINTQFMLRVIGEVVEHPDYIKQVNYVPITTKTSETNDNNNAKLYKIENLLPGRRYELQAEVIYTEDFKDKLSEPIRLWIEDEVHVQTEELFISPGERVVINCTGSVGPNDTSQKNLEWKLIDGNRLPDGSRSLKTQEAKSGPLWYAMESLIFDPVSKQHGGVYACFIRPSVSELMNKKMTLHNVTVTVSDLELDMNSEIVELGKKVIVTCRTASPGQLDWMLPSGEKIETVSELKPEDSEHNEPYALKEEDVDNVRLSMKLIIPKVNFNHAGKYVCLHSPSNNKQTFTLQMKEVINLVKSSESSDEPGKTLILDCTANLGNLHQSVIWYKRSNANSSWLEITETIQTIEHITIQHKNPDETSSSGVWLSQLKVKNSPGIIGELMCTIQNSKLLTTNIEQMETGLNEKQTMLMTMNDFSKITHAIIKISLKSVLKILTPMKSSTGQIKVHCQGYPAHSKDHLQWVYIPLNNPQKIIPIVHSNPKDEENEQETEEIMKELNEKEIDETVGLAFQLTDSIPATWPGSTGPQQLVQSSVIEHVNQPKQMYSAERLSLSFDSKYAEMVSDGTLVCRYLRPKGIIPIDTDDAAESLSKVNIPELNTNDDSDEVLEKSEISMKELLDAKEGDDTSILTNSLNNENDSNEADNIQSDGVRSNTAKQSISTFLYVNLIVLLIIFMKYETF
ncbi:Surface protein [Schistosoma japonicum]|uniref:Surface protein n=1 Tax=Schistosoma japonicum TaxID=6182 RepID=A0A4Z2CPE0_SCHJA|nr:Surface protein [Schistosoma japonicum]